MLSQGVGRKLITVLTFSLLYAVTLFAQDVNAISCENPVRIIFVRGSGQSTNGGEANKLKTALVNVLRPEQYEYLELQNDLPELVSLPSYDAVPVAGSLVGLKNGAQAIINASQFGTYRRSVESGKKLLNHLLRSYESKKICSVVSGYSQGAQVVGEVLSELPGNIKSYVIYAGLLGDPSLDLDGLDIIPGKNVPWYRGNAIPLIQKGVLGSRKPYLPATNQTLDIAAGSWCFNDDLICSSNYPSAAMTSSIAHGEYSERAIPQMALEIASIINNPTGIIDKNKKPADTCGPPKQDIVVLLDTSPLMRRDATIFSDTPMYYGSSPPAKLPTAGEMLLKSGCGDTRVAVVGYGQSTEGGPRLLLDFTKDPKAYDTLLKSLYAPATTGLYTRTQLREAALKATEVAWRPDTGKVLFAITDIAGSGPVGVDGWRNWDDSRVIEPYLKDPTSQQFLNTLRQHDIILTGTPVTHSYSGFQKADNDIAVSTDIIRYMRMISLITGGYHWPKQAPNYFAYNFKYNLLDQTINYAIQSREKTVASVPSVRGMLGKPISISVQDTISQFATAKLRNDNVSFRWYTDCNSQAKALNDVSQTVTFTPMQVGKCYGTVIARVSSGSGAGCYSCPEIFPPYMYRSFPFQLEIKPTDYIPKIPAQVTNITKVIRDNSVTYRWDKPVTNGSSAVVYVVTDTDGAVLAVTTAAELVVADSQKSDPEIFISAAGDDGKSSSVSSTEASVKDERTPEPVIEVIDDTPADPAEDEKLLDILPVESLPDGGQIDVDAKPTHSATNTVAVSEEPRLTARLTETGEFTEPQVLSVSDYHSVATEAFEGSSVQGSDIKNHETSEQAGQIPWYSVGSALLVFMAMAVTLYKRYQNNRV